MEGHPPRGRGVLKVKVLEAKYDAKLEFPGGRGGANLPWGYGYFLELHNEEGHTRQSHLISKSN